MREQSNNQQLTNLVESIMKCDDFDGLNQITLENGRYHGGERVCTLN